MLLLDTQRNQTQDQLLNFPCSAAVQLTFAHAQPSSPRRSATPARTRIGKSGRDAWTVAAQSLLVADLLRIGNLHALRTGRAGAVRDPVGRRCIKRHAAPRRPLHSVRAQRRDAQVSDLAKSQRRRGALSGRSNELTTAKRGIAMDVSTRTGTFTVKIAARTERRSRQHGTSIAIGIHSGDRAPIAWQDILVSDDPTIADVGIVV
jgi:hypothetical protein